MITFKSLVNSELLAILKKACAKITGMDNGRIFSMIKKNKMKKESPHNGCKLSDDVALDC